MSENKEVYHPQEYNQHQSQVMTISPYAYSLPFWVVSRQMLPWDECLLDILDTAFRCNSLHYVDQEKHRYMLMP